MVRTIMPHAPTTLDAALPAYQPAETEQFIDLHKSALYRYLDEITNQEVYLDNQGLELDDSDGDKVLVHIDELYVVPHLSEQRISPEELVEAGEEQQALDKLPLCSVAEMLSTHPRAVILGDPGVGKSTLLKWLLCSLSHWSDNYARRRIGPLFPLLLRARNLTADTILPCDNDDFIQLILRLKGKSLSGCIARDSEAFQVLKERLACGQVLLMVDGLDEVSDRVKAWLAEQIKQLLSDYPKIRLLMTSRVVGFEQSQFWCEASVEKAQEAGSVDDSATAQQRFFNDFNSKLRLGPDNNSQLLASFDTFPGPDEYSKLFSGPNKYSNLFSGLDEYSKLFPGSDKLAEDMLASQNTALNLPQTLFLVPFLPEQRRSFVKNWSEKYLPPQHERRLEFQEKLDDVSGNVKQINLLSRIPVLLNLICFIQWRRGQLPDGRAELYQRIVGTYLESMDKVRNVAPDFNDHYDYKDIRNWLGKLAFCMHAGDLCLPEDSLDSLSGDEEKLEELREALPVIGQQDMLLQISQTELEMFLALQLTEVMSVQDAKLQCIKLIDYLKCRTGFIIPKGLEQGQELYGFSHLSFQEYFAAYFISLNLGMIKEENKEVYEPLVASVGYANWEEVWLLVFEELTLQGNSRKQLDAVFNNLFATVPFIHNHSPYTRARIAINSAIKLSKRVKQETYKNLTKALLEGEIVYTNVVSHITKEFVKNRQQFTNILDDLHMLCVDEYLTDEPWPLPMSFYDRVSINYNTAQFVEQLPAFKTEFLNLINIDTDTTLPSLLQFSEVSTLGFFVVGVSGLCNYSHLVNVGCVSVYFGCQAVQKSLLTLPNLKELRLSNATFDALPQYMKVEKLALLDCKVDSFKALANLPSLKVLELHRLNDINDSDWTDLLEIEQLENLYILHSPNSSIIPDKLLEALEVKGVKVSIGAL
ncbi:NACHT domain-containing protein [Pseudoalteromonas sp. DL2-H2.2]|uniref:NACHT domain-containing protein n=1 Tax=Pseudoalteromonas sp. DL2-H2.2 TaxID=2908889 RepID=UPI001F419F33|nr:NACHT domain-containing protein [Pseudoalteromonas sp. DL2-H2.2]MCF2907714.1 NACHT domain-containing protein [Pseudoalteromonas sp. DL2-H2.2]